MSDNNVKLCKDCKHFEHLPCADCHHEKNLATDYINGGERSRFAIQYLRERSDYCGPQGAWFEKKED